MEYHIFYSWQSDLDQLGIDQRRQIRNAIESAKKTLEPNSGHSLHIDEATRGTSGAVNIVETIQQKINDCDVFIADVSIINKGSRRYRHTTNPNVMFELGLASESIGWDNIILVLNKHFGEFNDLPFDIKTRRAIRFINYPNYVGRKESYKKLSEELSYAIPLCLSQQSKLRLKEIAKELKNSVWEVFNFKDGKIDVSECKGMVTINQIHKHIFSFEFESYENNKKFPQGNWMARFFINENTLTTADLVFRSRIGFGFKRLMFPLDRNYEEIFLIGERPTHGDQVLRKMR